jgi:HEAT repeat protein
MMFGEKDPYERLIELEHFAKAADQHIGNLLKNQQEMIKAINSQSEQMKRLENTVKFYKKLLKEMHNETTGKK